MSLDSLTAKANTGTGLDPLAGKNTPAGFAGAVFVIDDAGNEITEANPAPTRLLAKNADYAPGYSGVAPGRAELNSDPHGNLIVRATTLTDEGSSRVNFANTSLAVSIGTATFANGSRVVTGTGFTTRIIDKGDYAKLNADAESAWAQIESIESDTELTLVSAYTGTGGTSNASRAMVRPVTGSGGAIAVASGECTLTSGTTINSVTAIERLVDYSPLAGNIGVRVSQRIANNETFIEFRDPATPSKYFLRIRLTGTVNTAAICETGYNPTGAPSAAETESTTVTLPNGATSATARVFRVESILSSVRYYCDNVLIAEHRRVGLHPNDTLLLRVSTVNGGSAPASSTTVTVDHLLAQNYNAVNITPSSSRDGFTTENAPPDTFTGSAAANNTDLLVIDCAKYRELWVQISGTFVGTVSYQQSNFADFTGQLPCRGTQADRNSQASSSTTAAQIVVLRPSARWVRIRTTAYTSGTPVATVFGVQNPAPPQALSLDFIAGGLSLPVNANSTETALIAPTASNINSAATTNATAVKTSAGTLYAINASGLTATPYFVKAYNKNSAPIVGTDVPVLVIPVPANGMAQPPNFGRTGHRFTAGIALAITSGIADSDTGACAANAVKVTLSYI